MFGNIVSQLRNLCLVALTVIVTSSAKSLPLRRSANSYNPCSTGTGEAEVKDFAVILEELKTTTEGVNFLAQDIKNSTGKRLEDVGLGNRLSLLDQISFVDPFPANSVAQEEIAGIFDRTALLTSHWSHLFNVTTLVNRARTHGLVGAAESDDNSDEANLRNQLDQLELQIDGVVCNVYDGLRSEGISEPGTPEYTLPVGFDNFQGDLRHEMYRVYILMEDVAMVTGHLNSVYKTM